MVERAQSRNSRLYSQDAWFPVYKMNDRVKTICFELIQVLIDEASKLMCSRQTISSSRMHPHTKTNLAFRSFDSCCEYSRNQYNTVCALQSS